MVSYYAWQDKVRINVVPIPGPLITVNKEMEVRQW